MERHRPRHQHYYIDAFYCDLMDYLIAYLLDYQLFLYLYLSNASRFSCYVNFILYKQTSMVTKPKPAMCLLLAIVQDCNENSAVC